MFSVYLTFSVLDSDFNSNFNSDLVSAQTNFSAQKMMSLIFEKKNSEQTSNHAVISHLLILKPCKNEVFLNRRKLATTSDNLEIR